MCAAIVAAFKYKYKNAKFFWLYRRASAWVLVNFVLKIPQPHVIRAPKAAAEVGNELKRRGCTKPLLVVDESIVKVGLSKRVTDSFEQAGLPFEVFDKVVPDPPSDLVEEGFKIYRNKGCDSLVGLGGGSCMDTAKAISIKGHHPTSNLKDFQGVLKLDLFQRKTLPLVVAVPTTAGTGSEVSPGAIITCSATGEKFAIVDYVITPKVAVLDPELILTLPASITASTGMDALTHAIESYVSTMQTAKSAPLSMAAAGTILRTLQVSYRNGSDMDARDAMLHASFQAGQAMSLASIGLVHALAHTLGSMYHVAHGELNAMLMPHVFRYYLQRDQEDGTTYVGHRLAEIARAGGIQHEGGERDAALALIRKIEELRMLMGMPCDIPDMKASDLDVVATRALTEENGEVFGWSRPWDHLFDPGYPSPYYATHEECKAIAAKVLSPAERAAYH